MVINTFKRELKMKMLKLGKKEYYNDNKDKSLIQNEQNYYYTREGRLQYIERRRHDYAFREKQRQYYIIHYQKNKEKSKCLYYNNYLNRPSKFDFIVSFSFSATHKKLNHIIILMMTCRRSGRRNGKTSRIWRMSAARTLLGGFPCFRRYSNSPAHHGVTGTRHSWRPDTLTQSTPSLNSSDTKYTITKFF
jgi:hypothetical protein